MTMWFKKKITDNNVSQSQNQSFLNPQALSDVSYLNKICIMELKQEACVTFVC